MGLSVSGLPHDAVVSTRETTWGEPDDMAVELKRRRVLMGLTQKEVASRIGSSQAFVSDYERGSRAPGWRVLKRMMRTLGVMEVRV